MIKQMLAQRLLSESMRCLWFITLEIWCSKLNELLSELITRVMESVRIAEITLAKQGFRYFQEPHSAWHVNKKRNDAEFIPA
jgi:hypothetical protein